MKKIITTSVFAAFFIICFGAYFLFFKNNISDKVSPFVKSASVHVSNAVGNELGDDKKLTNKEYIESLNTAIDEIGKSIHSVKMLKTEGNKEEIELASSYLQSCKVYLKSLREINSKLMGFEVKISLLDNQINELLGVILDKNRYEMMYNARQDSTGELYQYKQNYAKLVPSLEGSTSALKKQISNINKLVAINALIDPAKLDMVNKAYADSVKDKGPIDKKFDRSFELYHKVKSIGLDASIAVLKREVLARRRFGEEEAQKVWFNAVSEQLKKSGLVK